MNPIRFTKLVGIALISVVCLFSLVSCSTTPTQSTIPTDSSQQAAPTSPPEIQETVVTFAIAEDPPSFNPLVADTGYDALVSRLVMLGVTGIDPQGQVIPKLAAELRTLENGGVVVDEDAGTMDVTWKMRQEVSWADGDMVTADDVIFTGCKHCYPAVATNLADRIFPARADSTPFHCEVSAAAAAWPPVAGEYFVLPENRSCHVAVSTLASIPLAEELARQAPKGLCIVGKTETENIGIDKVIRNTITNPVIHCLIVAGRDSEGHRSGATPLSLCERGVDERMKVIGSPGRKPVLKNVTRKEVEAFRNQVRIVDMIGCEDAGLVARKVKVLARKMHMHCGVKDYARVVKPLTPAPVERVEAGEPAKVTLDKAGYFVILPVPAKGILTVEHYANDNRLLRVIEGKEARSLYSTIIRNGWVSQLSHAAYLGKELERAELSMKMGFKFIQDRA